MHHDPARTEQVAANGPGVAMQCSSVDESKLAKAPARDEAGFGQGLDWSSCQKKQQVGPGI